MQKAETLTSTAGITLLACHLDRSLRVFAKTQWRDPCIPSLQQRILDRVEEQCCDLSTASAKARTPVEMTI
jgi:hypothetical protein